MKLHVPSRARLPGHSLAGMADAGATPALDRNA